MEMHSRDSLYHTHGINTERQQPRPRRWAWALIGWIRRFFVEFKQAIETEFAVRQAIIELETSASRAPKSKVRSPAERSNRNGGGACDFER